MWKSGDNSNHGLFNREEKKEMTSSMDGSAMAVEINFEEEEESDEQQEMILASMRARYVSQETVFIPKEIQSEVDQGKFIPFFVREEEEELVSLNLTVNLQSPFIPYQQNRLKRKREEEIHNYPSKDSDTDSKFSPENKELSKKICNKNSPPATEKQHEENTTSNGYPKCF